MSARAARRRRAGGEDRGGAGALADEAADPRVEPLDRADRRGGRRGQLGEDAAVDRDQLARRLARDRRQALGAG